MGAVSSVSAYMPLDVEGVEEADWGAGGTASQAQLVVVQSVRSNAGKGRREAWPRGPLRQLQTVKYGSDNEKAWELLVVVYVSGHKIKNYVFPCFCVNLHSHFTMKSSLGCI